MKAYLSSGWFSPEQEESRQDILTALTEAGFEIYSPKEDLMYKPGETPANDVFMENIIQIEDSDVMVCSTEGKDMGSIFEAGYANAINIPIVYYWKGGSGKFNLMLAQSAHAVYTSKERLSDYLHICLSQNVIIEIPYTGEQE